jgi:hypothetical protein
VRAVEAAVVAVGVVALAALVVAVAACSNGRVAPPCPVCGMADNVRESEHDADEWRCGRCCHYFED